MHAIQCARIAVPGIMRYLNLRDGRKVQTKERSGNASWNQLSNAGESLSNYMYNYFTDFSRIFRDCVLEYPKWTWSRYHVFMSMFRPLKADLQLMFKNALPGDVLRFSFSFSRGITPWQNHIWNVFTAKCWPFSTPQKPNHAEGYCSLQLRIFFRTLPCWVHRMVL